MSVHARIVVGLLLVFFWAVPAAAQTQVVLFDGLVHDDRQAAALIVPAVVTEDTYSLFGRVEYGLLDHANVFLALGGAFNGGATGLAGGGWAATFYRQSDALPVNIGFFNSYIAPLERGGPDVFVTLAPVFSHSWERASGRVTPYAGATATLKIGGRGTDVNGLIGVKVTEIADSWDFVVEVQPGEKTLFGVGFIFRF